MAVARITQIIGASPHSWEDAVRNALERANKTLRGITGIEVAEGERRGRGRQDRRVPRHRAGHVRPRGHLRQRPWATAMTALDAAFYHLERTGQLLHVGGVYTVDGPLDYERTLADLSARLHLIPRYTAARGAGAVQPRRIPPGSRRAASTSGTTWCATCCAPPGDDEQLRSLASRLFAEPLDRSRPLWELHQIDGYRGDRSAILAKVHHCMIDGVSGVQLLGVMFDVTPTPAPPPPAPPSGATAPPLPTPSAQAWRALADGAATARRGAARARASCCAGPREAWDELREAASAVSELLRARCWRRMPHTPFNGFVGSLRRIEWVTFSLNEVKAVKNRLGGTVNDVILATITRRAAPLPGGPRREPRSRRAARHVPGERAHGGRAPEARQPRLGDDGAAAGRHLRPARAPAPGAHGDGAAQARGRVGAHEPRDRPARATCPRRSSTSSAGCRCRRRSTPSAPTCPARRCRSTSRAGASRRWCPIVPLAQGVGLAFAILSYADAITIGVNLDPGADPRRRAHRRPTCARASRSCARSPACSRARRRRRCAPSASGGRRRRAGRVTA